MRDPQAGEHARGMAMHMAVGSVYNAEMFDSRPWPTDEERAALRAKMPKKWQDRRGPTA